jgi:hypothetical protein
MYAKISGGTVTKFPYTFGDLRKDHPNVSFPKNITATIMQKYGMVGVLEGPKPTLGAYQTVQRNALPTRPVIGQYTEEDAPDESMIGEDIIANYWMIEYTAVDMFADTTETDEDDNEVTTTKAEHEAAYQATLDAATATANRKKRDELLAETDYLALSDNTLSAEMTTYRQALRDITDHANWPNLSDDDWPTKP